jgi:hypothetical protein
MKILIMVLSLYVCCLGAYHSNERGASIHTPFRWVVADSVERLALTVTTSDTDKCLYQKSDSTMWILRDNSPKTWILFKSKKYSWIDIDTIHGPVRTDTLYCKHIAPDSIWGPTVIHNATKATFTGAVNADSLALTKGATTTSVRYPGSSTGLSLSTSGITAEKAIVFGVKDTSANPSVSGITSPHIYATYPNPTGYKYPFNEFSNLVIQGCSNSLRDIVFMNGTSPKCFMNITSSGKVGIGIQVPDSTFTDSGSIHVVGNALFDKLVRVDSLRLTRGVSATNGNFTSKVKGSYFTTNGEDSLTYEDTTFYDSLYEDATYKTRVLSRIIKIGNVVHLYQSTMTSSFTGSGYVVTLKGIPSRYRPSDTIYNTSVFVLSSTVKASVVSITYTGNIDFVKTDDTVLGSGTHGTAYTVLTWIL